MQTCACRAIGASSLTLYRHGTKHSNNVSHHDTALAYIQCREYITYRARMLCSECLAKHLGELGSAERGVLTAGAHRPNAFLQFHFFVWILRNKGTHTHTHIRKRNAKCSVVKEMQSAQQLQPTNTTPKLQMHKMQPTPHESVTVREENLGKCCLYVCANSASGLYSAK